eukprot:c28560_g1_i1 orf=594-2804(-)
MEVAAASSVSVREVVCATTLANAPGGSPKALRLHALGAEFWGLGGRGIELPSSKILCIPEMGNAKWFPTKNDISARYSAERRALVERCVSVMAFPSVLGDNVVDRLRSLEAEFEPIIDSRERVQKLRDYAAHLPELPSNDCIPENRVMGCTARVWLTASLGSDGRMYFAANSDSELTRGFCACLILVLNGAWPQEVLEVSLASLPRLGMGLAVGITSRANTWYNILLAMQKKTQVAVAQLEGRPAFEPFPSLLITANDITPHGSFAVAQAKYLSPDEAKVQELVDLLQQKQIGVVAHFYMDPEVQGVLAAAQKIWPHIHISDSLVMADRAVRMAEGGCKNIAVLGVDFMSENVRAILDQAGHEQVNVYRMSSEHIGCSLAAAAESSTYSKFLESASESGPALHVIYINTSLETKARAHAIVPTITCTSSNVVQTVLQAFAQVPNVTIWYGPDSYMGANLAEMFRQISDMTDEEIAAIHPLHNKQSVKALLSRLHYFQDGSCIVHDLFGHEVVSHVRQNYCDAFLTAHFEVPGEMFALATEARQRDMGVVGSTQNILDFIKLRVQEAVSRNFDDRLQFVLGTETGMVTAIVGAVREILLDGRLKGSEANIEVEIVFPVSPDAISTVPSSLIAGSPKSNLSKLSIVPGVSSGEGCSLNGGCASCPYMKMNSLDSLFRVCCMVGTPLEPALVAQQAHRSENSLVEGYSVAEFGCKPILNMCYFQSKGRLPEELVSYILR